MATIQPLLSKALNENSFSLSSVTQQKLIRYLELVQSWNRVVNLTAITAPHDLVYLHIIDSLSVLPYLNGTNMLDVGSGAGLPGIPLALADPDKKWTLLDKNSKKTRFLTQVVSELAMENVKIVHGRCEDFHPSAGFDTILSRAFGTMRLFLETTVHLVGPHGVFIAMKGKYPQEEIKNIPDPFIVQNVVRLDIKGMNVDRHLVCLQKKRNDGGKNYCDYQSERRCWQNDDQHQSRRFLCRDETQRHAH